MVTTETNSPYHYLKRSTWPTQAGKTELKAMGCGQGKESRVLTIHEAQGLASKMCTQVELRRCATQKVKEWEQASCPSSPQEIEEGSIPSPTISALSESKIEERRLSMLPRTKKGRGAEMDLATREANELLLKGKEALESAGNMKRECKSVATECLQSLYEIVLALSDSRSEHKYNLEAERKHAQELVRIERPTTKI
ncbi:hypothetical protein EVAR_23354_1 [Eumeta japonica]|uniref:Uncharacterized protein n=1 Tax=Eumeta variegata TaxID=151549 RepID=A0A4C1XYG6_EUMVA|nr:hypothetical protein EVAR_23354_1 [Eumeta japonica]